jgi:hypothetical protein
MKPSPLPRVTDHESYRRHRKQMWAQVILPVLAGALILVVAPLGLWLTLGNGGGDVGRWAAISTIWLLFPPLIGGLIVLLVVITLIFVGSRIYGGIPRFTSKAQLIAGRVAAGARRSAALIRSPVLAVRAVASAARNRLTQLRRGAKSSG